MFNEIKMTLRRFEPNSQLPKISHSLEEMTFWKFFTSFPGVKI